ncbi:hypothetical protein [Vibrio sp. Hep-1b-8]|uniref:hypothetical protein n=1 Tax=Vibrio sp. Hep-1b-8 TaxID=2144187 RepID=UPI00111032DE|nr:hypothetical protein [Vibrio sp. Hep-1b-8]TMX36844.1 hypothetical protein DA100_12285 [Vibrio sp. Hep-1b-8]
MILRTFSDPRHVEEVADWLKQQSKGATAELTVANNPGGQVALLNLAIKELKLALNRGVKIKVVFHGDIASCAAVFFSVVLQMVNETDVDDHEVYPDLTISFLNPIYFIFHTPRLNLNQQLFKTNYNSTKLAVDQEMQHLYQNYYPMFESAFEEFMLWYNTNVHQLDIAKRFELYEDNVDVRFL